MDSLLDMVSISALVAPVSGVSSLVYTCDHLDSLASWMGATGVCCLDNHFPRWHLARPSSMRVTFFGACVIISLYSLQRGSLSLVAVAHCGATAFGSVLHGLQSWSSSLIWHRAGSSGHDVPLPSLPTAGDRRSTHFTGMPKRPHGRHGLGCAGRQVSTPDYPLPLHRQSLISN